MSSVVILGTQYGDEGKGKFVDVLAGKADMVVRFQGGNNAGHTIILGEEKFVFNLLPSGVLYDKAKCIIASGVVIDLHVFLKEVEVLKSRGRKVDHIFISDKAHLIMPYHITLDKLKESNPSQKIGTTQRGIGPTYADKINRVGIRVADLVDFETFKEKLKINVEEKNPILTKIYGVESINEEQILKDFAKYREQILSRVVDSSAEINSYLDNNKLVMFEGAQGSQLDIDFGTYPYVTSSSPSVGGVLIGSGISHKKIDKVVGIVKAYTTRVGNGPFVSECLDSVGDTLREKGFEFGAVTKRPRRCGWLDLIVLKSAVEKNALTDMVITKLDILSHLPEIKVCIAYEIDGVKITTIPTDLKKLAQAKPVYKTFKGWNTDISEVISFDKLPTEAQEYILFIEKFLEVSASIVSVGPERSQNIVRKQIV
ncbi:MAG: adenylosuccinate synthase [Alphaproteobacteria bacterium]|jgi:adenylosuccinate synthase|nr:adenylosuccinate synthase [Alphaproteobacteria bacterium]